MAEAGHAWSWKQEWAEEGGYDQTVFGRGRGFYKMGHKKKQKHLNSGPAGISKNKHKTSFPGHRESEPRIKAFPFPKWAAAMSELAFQPSPTQSHMAAFCWLPTGGSASDLNLSRPPASSMASSRTPGACETEAMPTHVEDVAAWSAGCHRTPRGHSHSHNSGLVQ